MSKLDELFCHTAPLTAAERAARLGQTLAQSPVIPFRIPPAPAFSIPSPRTLDPSCSDTELAGELLRLHNAWYRHATKKPLYSAIAHVLQHPKYKMLCTAGRWLADNGIAPRTWLKWSLGVWSCYDGKNCARYPSLLWLWSPKRMVEREEWFRREQAAYAIPVRIHTAAYAELWRCYNLAVLAVLGGQSAEVVEAEYLPKQQVAELWAQACTEAQEKQRYLERQLAVVDWPEGVV